MNTDLEMRSAIEHGEEDWLAADYRICERVQEHVNRLRSMCAKLALSAHYEVTRDGLENFRSQLDSIWHDELGQEAAAMGALDRAIDEIGARREREQEDLERRMHKFRSGGM
jgi:transposase